MCQTWMRRSSTRPRRGSMSRGSRGSEAAAHVVVQHLLEVASDMFALEGDHPLAIHVDRRGGLFTRAGQTDTDIGMATFTGPIHHAAHHRYRHGFDTRIAVAPNRHLLA